jgi:hypothetical protein
MAAVPHFTSPSTPTWPVWLGPSRPAATVLRFPCSRALTPVAPDPCEGRVALTSAELSHEIAASWALFLGLAILGFVLF